MRRTARPTGLLVAVLSVVAVVTTACPPETGTPPEETTTTTSTTTTSTTTSTTSTSTTTSTTTTTLPPDDPNGRYVATTGTDAGDCSASAAPCLTVNYAVGQAVSGNTVYVAAGDYAEIVAPNKDLTFKGANAGIAAGVSPGVRGTESVVKGFRNSGNPGTISYTTTIDGFRIDPQGDTALLSATLQPLVWLRGGTTVVENNVFSGGSFVANCTFTCTTMMDSAFTVQSGSVAFSNNTIENFRRPVTINQALGAPATSATVSGNAFTGITSRALSLAGSTGVQMGGQTVTGNSFDATGRTSPSSPAGITISNGGNVISGNTFTGFASGVYLDLCKKFVTSNNAITGNTFTGNNGGVNISVNTDGGQCVSSATEGSGGWVAGGGRINGMTITGNNFSGNTSYAIRHAAFNWGFFTSTAPTSTGPVDATCNFYGTPAAPNYASYSYPPGTVAANPDGVIGTAAPETSVNVTPWRTATAPAGACDGV